jgi:hypothetical protein
MSRENKHLPSIPPGYFYEVDKQVWGRLKIIWVWNSRICEQNIELLFMNYCYWHAFLSKERRTRKGIKNITYSVTIDTFVN